MMSTLLLHWCLPFLGTGFKNVPITTSSTLEINSMSSELFLTPTETDYHDNKVD